MACSTDRAKREFLANLGHQARILIRQLESVQKDDAEEVPLLAKTEAKKAMDPFRVIAEGFPQQPLCLTLQGLLRSHIDS